MKRKIAKKILEMEKDKLMSEPEANRDWELITALDIAIETMEQVEQEVDDVSPCANCQEFDCYGCKVKE